MISSLRGTVLSVTGSVVVVEVAGVGYSVQVTPQHALSLRPGGEAFVITILIVRDDALSLYGFADVEQRVVFELLTGVSGVGPKSALGVLAHLTPEQIASAVSEDDDAAFRAVSGIGPKTAKLIVVQLAGKLAALAPAAPRASSSTDTELSGDVVVALTGLGWSERVAQSAVQEVMAETDARERDSVPQLLRLVLSRLGPSANPARAANTR